MPKAALSVAAMALFLAAAFTLAQSRPKPGSGSKPSRAANFSSRDPRSEPGVPATDRSAQSRPKSRKPPPRPQQPADGKVATGEEPDFTRFRVVIDAGILVVFDADEEWDGRDEPYTQLAYWHDFGTQQLFFFDQLLFTPDDVLQSIAAMPRDLAIDPAPLIAEKPELGPLPEMSSPGQWRPAIEADVLAVMSGGQAAAEGTVSGLNEDCAPGTCPDPELLSSGPLWAPVRGTPPDQLFASASRGGNCNCTGGGGCSDGCPDPDLCTQSYCDITNVCVFRAVDCDDANPCTIDTCDPGSEGCEYTPKDCPPPDDCTTPSCDDLTGECRSDSYCGGHCCTDNGAAWCCAADKTCCRYYWPGNAEDSACCPPDRPFCCDNGPNLTDCCETPEQCCPTGCCPIDRPHCCEMACCEQPEDCCNGDCKGDCDVQCCADGWHSGPCCGTGGCESWQVCCDGQCCGSDPCNPGQCDSDVCVIVPACDDGNECTDDPCTIGECGDFTCEGHPHKADGTPCTPDSMLCSLDHCVSGVCSHPPKCLGEAAICCADGTCCATPCNRCIDNGEITAGSIAVDPPVACIGETITFTLTGAEDTGGTKQINCHPLSIPPVEPTITWIIIKPEGSTVSGSGRVATVVAELPGEYSCTFTANVARDCPPPPNLVGPTTARSPELVELEWQAFQSALDECENNEGTRIFPERGYNGTDIDLFTRVVQVVATVSPAREGCAVFFSVWDVDDPFDQMHVPCLPGNSPPGCIRELDLIDSDSFGLDNNGVDLGLDATLQATDSNGQGTVLFFISQQPGDNFRAGASVVQSALIGTTQGDADANTSPQFVLFTDMLTVWRTVWLELDSMANGRDIEYTGNIDAVINNSPHAGDSRITLHVPDINDDGRFEGGTLSVPSTQNAYTIIDNKDDAFWDSYFLSAPVMNADLNQSATVTDDDAFVLPRLPAPDPSVLDGIYKPCYIKFRTIPEASDEDVGFQATFPFLPTQATQKGIEQQDLHPLPGYWTAIIVSSYQSYHPDDSFDMPYSSVDLDPDWWYHIHGTHPNATLWTIGDVQATLAITPVSDLPVSNVTLIFQETIRDYVAQINLDPHMFSGHSRNQSHAFVESRVIAHEIAHQFGIEDHVLGSLVGEWTGTVDPLFGSQIN